MDDARSGVGNDRDVQPRRVAFENAVEMDFRHWPQLWRGAFCFQRDQYAIVVVARRVVARRVLHTGFHYGANLSRSTRGHSVAGAGASVDDADEQWAWQFPRLSGDRLVVQFLHTRTRDEVVAILGCAFGSGDGRADLFSGGVSWKKNAREDLIESMQ